MRLGNEGGGNEGGGNAGEAVRFLANHAGGVLGGISTAQHLVARFAVKPTSSIRVPPRTGSADRVDIALMTKCHHSTCGGIRPVHPRARKPGCKGQSGS